MECKLLPGQRVVFNGPFDDMDAAIFAAFPEKGFKMPDSGKVYTIRRVYIANGGAVCVHLVELTNRHLYRDDNSEPGFPAKYFKPLDETRLDVFRSMLNPVGKKELQNG
jgi:hypothetical protein